MKVAILSDIHGNKFALEEVLEVCRKEGVNDLLILGDLVGYYYYSDAVLEMLSHFECSMIRGNHEAILQDLLEKKVGTEAVRAKYGSGHAESLKRLSNEALKQLFRLPDTREVTIANVKILMCHGSPWNRDFYIYPDADREVLNKCDRDGVDFIFIGHSHYQFAFCTANNIVINAGSVGQSRQAGGIANWALLDCNTRSFQLRSTPYNVRPLLEAVKAFDSDISYLSDILIRNNKWITY